MVTLKMKQDVHILPRNLLEGRAHIQQYALKIRTNFSVIDYWDSQVAYVNTLNSEHTEQQSVFTVKALAQPQQSALLLRLLLTLFHGNNISKLFLF